MKRVLVVTEANTKVASGHLLECLVLCDVLKDRDINPTLLINADMPPDFKQRIHTSYKEYDENIQNEINTLKTLVCSEKYDAIIFNLREIKNELISQIRPFSPMIICIDEFGNRRLDADVIINPMIDFSYWTYDTKAKTYCGLGYLVLSPQLQNIKQQKITQNEIADILITMGGVDAYGTTLKLANYFAGKSNYNVDIVIGGGFKKKEELLSTINGVDNISIFSNIELHEMYNLMINADVAFCAGGNTLHELAVIGTPAIVIPTMPHEIKNGRAYERKGFGICINDALNFSCDEIEKTINKLNDFTIRQSMSDNGRNIADGLGYERVCNIIEKCCDKSCVY